MNSMSKTQSWYIKAGGEVKGKVVLVFYWAVRHEDVEKWVSGQLHALAALLPAKEPSSTHCIRWLGERQSRFVQHEDSDQLIVKPVGSLYTDCTTAAR
jgi:hypothetical protein